MKLLLKCSLLFSLICFFFIAANVLFGAESVAILTIRYDGAHPPKAVYDPAQFEKIKVLLPGDHLSIRTSPRELTGYRLDYEISGKKNVGSSGMLWWKKIKWEGRTDRGPQDFIAKVGSYAPVISIPEYREGLFRMRTLTICDPEALTVVNAEGELRIQDLAIGGSMQLEDSTSFTTEQQNILENKKAEFRNAGYSKDLGGRLIKVTGSPDVSKIEVIITKTRKLSD